MAIKVTYMSGAGNIFAVIDGRDYDFTERQYSILSPAICNSFEKDSSAEGLLVVICDDNYDFLVLFFNPDGSSGMMCGNGGRCAVRFALETGFISNKKDIRFFMSGDSYLSNINEGRISLEMPPPREFVENFDINLNNSAISGSYVNVGSDHFVINVNDLDMGSVQDIKIDELSPPVRHHKTFAPRGVNVNYYDIIEADKLILRTFERGVEAETGACGTGAIATALTAYIKDYILLPITIVPTSGIPLEVDIVGSFINNPNDNSNSNTNDNPTNNIEKFILTGSADILFHKELFDKELFDN